MAWDLAGFAGPAGPVADGSHAIKYATEGRWGDALLSAVGALPLFGDGLVGLVKGPRITAKTSKLLEFSGIAFRTAERTGSLVAPKHLAGAGGTWSKFAHFVDAEKLARQALRSKNAVFMLNRNANKEVIDGFVMLVDMGRQVGSKASQTVVKFVFAEDGTLITVFPVRPPWAPF